MAGEKDYQKTIRILCGQDGASLSKDFRTFFEYQDLIDANLQMMIAAPDLSTDMQANAHIQRLQKEQALFAQSHGIYAALKALGGIHAHCREGAGIVSPR